MIHTTVLYVAPALAVGGAEKFLALLSAGLTRDTKRQTIVSLSENNPLLPEFKKEIEFHCIPRVSKFDMNAIFKLRKLIKTENPDVAVCLNFFSYIFFRFAIIGLGTNVKRIISYHSTIHLNRKEHFLHKLYSMVLTRRDLIVTVSKNQASYTAKKYGIPAELFKTIYNGIDTMHWRLPEDNSARIKTRNEYGIPQDAKVIVLTAAFRPEKRHVKAVRALHVLHQQHNCKAYLLLVGNGVLMEEIKNITSELQMQAYVKFAGIQQDVRPFYWAADLFTLCSDSETFSIAALEGMACGLPAVLTDIGGANEMVTQGFNGYLCRQDEHEIAATWVKALAHQFSAAEISDYVKVHFDKNKMIDEYKTTLVDAINDHQL